jgi:hypothetical protein
MAAPIIYQTLNGLGMDPSVYYVNAYAAGGSVTPEYPAPPFLPGMQAIGTDGSQFVFVQASTSISLTDIVMLNVGQTTTPYQANSINTTNVFGSLAFGIGATGLVLKQSVSFIPAGAYFWAQTRGQYIPATNSGGVLTAAPAASGGVGSIALYTALTGVGVGIITSVTTTASPGFAGIVCINSLTSGISASVIPPIGTLSSVWASATTQGLTVGPVICLNNPRMILVGSSGVGLSANANTAAAAGTSGPYSF